MSDTVLNFRTTVYASAPWLQENDKQEIDEKLQIYKKIYYLQNWFIFLNFIHNYFALIGSFRSWWSFFYQKKKLMILTSPEYNICYFFFILCSQGKPLFYYAQSIDLSKLWKSLKYDRF